MKSWRRRRQPNAAAGGNMKILAKEKHRVLAEANHWSLQFAEGYLDGEMHRRRGRRPSSFALVGRDDYCLGFRTGYFERHPKDIHSSSGAEAEIPAPASVAA
jgi:hypothetical protein